jgi:hypothetical protein
MTGLAGVDNCETAMAQTRAPARIVNRFGSPSTFIVAPTMLDGSEHRGNALLGLETD